MRLLKFHGPRGRPKLSISCTGDPLLFERKYRFKIDFCQIITKVFSIFYLNSYVYDTNVGDIAPLTTYFNPNVWSDTDLNNKFGQRVSLQDAVNPSCLGPIYLPL